MFCLEIASIGKFVPIHFQNPRELPWLSVLGVIVLALTYFFGEQLQSFLKEILLIAGWFAIWESVDKFVLGRRLFRKLPNF